MLDTETFFEKSLEEENRGTEAAGTDALPPLVPLRPLAAVAAPAGLRAPAPAGRRLGAAVIDRLLPLPFLVAFFWPWALVVLGYDLLRDAAGASVGKRLLGLETVQVSPDPALDGRACGVGRSLLRNLPWAAARLCYLVVVLSVAGFALDVTAGLLVLLSAGGASLGDRLGGTRVVVTDKRGGAERRETW